MANCSTAGRVMHQIDLSEVRPAPRVRSIRYYGGKSPMGRGTGKWIAALLPNDADTVYCEPFAGMLGVLLQRAPARHEIVNDLNGDIVNFWRVLRDQPEELAHKILCTPQSRELFFEAHSLLQQSPPSIDRAWAVYTVLNWSYQSRLTDRSFALSTKCALTAWKLPQFKRLYERVKNIAIENCDGAELISRLGDDEKVVFYIDPPYPSAVKSREYCGIGANFDKLLPALQRLRCRAAISGYPGEWDFLGWRRRELEVVNRAARTKKKERVVECLWTNW